MGWSPSSEAFHSSKDWNTSGTAHRYGRSSLRSTWHERDRARQGDDDDDDNDDDDNDAEHDWNTSGTAQRYGRSSLRSTWGAKGGQARPQDYHDDMMRQPPTTRISRITTSDPVSAAGVPIHPGRS
jgi:hypothetical protein